VNREVCYDGVWRREVGYGVPAFCDHPECRAVIHRGLEHVCGGTALGSAGCGLYFCEKHLASSLQLCERCLSDKPPFSPSGEHRDWLMHKLTHPHWCYWREANAAEVERIRREMQQTMTVTA